MSENNFRKRLEVATPGNVRRAMIFGAITTSAIAIVAFLIGRWSAGHVAIDEPMFCTFDRHLGFYEVTPRELEGDGFMMTVSRGDRVFMFKRQYMTSCYSEPPESTLPEPINGTRLESLQEDPNE